MKGQGKEKGILIEGNDGHEYLLGFGPDNSPIFSRRQTDGTFEPLEDVLRASKVAITQSGHTGGLIGPGMGNYTWLWGAYRKALGSICQPWGGSDGLSQDLTVALSRGGFRYRPPSAAARG